MGDGYVKGAKILTVTETTGAYAKFFTLTDAPDESWYIDTDGCLACKEAPTKPVLLLDRITTGKNVKTSLGNLLPPGYAGQVSFSSSDEKVLKIIKKNGKFFKGLETGTATLTATYANGTTLTIPVEVVPKKDAVLSVTGVKKLNVGIAKSKTVKVKVKSATAKDKTLIWYSTNESVATVNAGTITGVGKGKCNIVALSASGKRLIIKLTVKNAK